jgi:hypothetical protein
MKKIDEIITDRAIGIIGDATADERDMEFSYRLRSSALVIYDTLCSKLNEPEPTEKEKASFDRGFVWGMEVAKTLDKGVENDRTR